MYYITSIKPHRQSNRHRLPVNDIQLAKRVSDFSVRRLLRRHGHQGLSLSAFDHEASCELKRLNYHQLRDECAVQDIATSKFVGKSIVDVIFKLFCFDVEAKQFKMF
jgi:hypothetical protein